MAPDDFASKREECSRFCAAVSEFVERGANRTRQKDQTQAGTECVRLMLLLINTSRNYVKIRGRSGGGSGRRTDLRMNKDAVDRSYSRQLNKIDQCQAEIQRPLLLQWDPMIEAKATGPQLVQKLFRPTSHTDPRDIKPHST